MSTVFERHPAKTLAITLLAGIVLLLAATETLLRHAGWMPGRTIRTDESGYFRFVNELRLKATYETDSSGIMKINSELAKYATRDVVADEVPEQYLEAVGYVSEYVELDTGRWDNGLYRRISAIRAKPPESRSESDAAYLDYIRRPINSDGFKSIEFERYADDSSKTSVLLLGDSFTWGATPSTMTNCFADELAGSNYIVYNTGIPGADPAQYLAIAKRYIPMLRPDVVCVNFFMGNDLVWFVRKPQPYQPLYYETNAGNLYAYPDGVLLPTPQIAYDFVVIELSIPQNQGSAINDCCAKTAIGTRLWMLADDLNLIRHNKDTLFNKYRNGQMSPTPVSERFLLEIEKICRENNASYLLAAIPEVKELHLKIPDDYKGFLTRQHIHVPPNITQADYDMADEHFNDSGHWKYARFLDSLITEAVSKL